MVVRSWTVQQNYRTRNNINYGWPSYREVTLNYTSSEQMFSINHYPLNTSGDDGGPWSLTRSLNEPTFGYFDGNAGKLYFDGQFCVQKPSTAQYMGGVTGLSDAALDAFGTTAIARTAPTNPAFDMSTFLGETLSDGFPSLAGLQLWKERTQAARSATRRSNYASAAGGEYLNQQFGWAPLISDIRGFAKAVKNSNEILHQYRKDSDRKIRRGYDGTPDEETRFVQYPNMGTVPVYFTGPGYVYERKSVKRWFRGAFRYHIPVADDTLGKFQKWVSLSDHLLGWKVTPETVWNVAPWSWALDWFANTGDIMTNVSNLGRDGLVLQYGYSMATSTKETRMYGTFSARYGQVASASQYWLTEYKQRRPATPYGFGVDLHGLSPRQIAITAALGLNRT